MEAFLRDLAKLFASYGIPTRSLYYTFARGEESICVFRVLLGVESSPQISEGWFKATSASFGELGLMFLTMETAQLLQAHGAKRVHVYDALHAIESALWFAIVHSGRPLSEPRTPRYWAVFKKYETLAEAGGMSGPEITFLRREAAEKDSVRYERGELD